MSFVSDVTEQLGGPLGWTNLVKEGLSIMLFLVVWNALSGFFYVFGLIFMAGIDPRSPGSSLVLMIIAFILFGIGFLLFSVSNYIVIMRVLGKSVALALNHSDVDSVVTRDGETA